MNTMHTEYEKNMQTMCFEKRQNMMEIFQNIKTAATDYDDDMKTLSTENAINTKRTCTRCPQQMREHQRNTYRMVTEHEHDLYTLRQEHAHHEQNIPTQYAQSRKRLSRQCEENVARIPAEHQNCTNTASTFHQQSVAGGLSGITFQISESRVTKNGHSCFRGHRTWETLREGVP